MHALFSLAIVSVVVFLVLLPQLVELYLTPTVEQEEELPDLR